LVHLQLKKKHIEKDRLQTVILFTNQKKENYRKYKVVQGLDLDFKTIGESLQGPLINI